MDTIHIRTKLESETLHLPELKPLVGRVVEIFVVADKPASAAAPTELSVQGTGDWDAAARAAQELRDSNYDFDAWRRQRDFDSKHVNVPPP